VSEPPIMTGYRENLKAEFSSQDSAFSVQ